MEKKEKIDYAPLLPLQPPAELWDNEQMKKALDAHVLVFKSAWIFAPLEDRNVQAAEVHCSCCGEVFYTDFIKETGCRAVGYGFIHPETHETIRSGKMTLCPFCGTVAKAVHVSSFGSSKCLTVARVWPMTFHKIGEHFGILTWYVEKSVDKNGVCKNTVYPYEAYISEGKKAIKLVGYRKSFCLIQQLGIWEQRARCEDTYRVAGKEPILPLYPEILKGTEMENSKLDLLLKECKGTYPVSYMQVYLKHNNVENLLMNGLTGLVNEMLERYSSRKTYRGSYGIQKDLHGIDWKKLRPCEMLHMNKQEFEFFIEKCADVESLNKWVMMKEKKAQVRIEDLTILKKYTLLELQAIVETDPDIMRVVRYLEKQKRKYPRDHVDGYALRDYRAMMRELGENGEPYPQRLNTAHDQMADALNRKKKEIEAKKMKERYKALCRYCFSYGDLMIRPAKNEREFQEEGRKLHHCVRSYCKKHAEGKTAIFFIRRKDAPEEPFFTLEYNEKTGTVIQNRGKHNCDRTAEVEAFEKAWLKWIKNGKKQEKEKNGHGKSKQRGAADAAA